MSVFYSPLCPGLPSLALLQWCEVRKAAEGGKLWREKRSDTDHSDKIGVWTRFQTLWFATEQEKSVNHKRGTTMQLSLWKLLWNLFNHSYNFICPYQISLIRDFTLSHSFQRKVGGGVWGDIFILFKNIQPYLLTLFSSRPKRLLPSLKTMNWQIAKRIAHSSEFTGYDMCLCCRQTTEGWWNKIHFGGGRGQNQIIWDPIKWTSSRGKTQLGSQLAPIALRGLVLSSCS